MNSEPRVFVTVRTGLALAVRASGRSLLSRWEHQITFRIRSTFTRDAVCGIVVKCAGRKESGALVS